MTVGASGVQPDERRSEATSAAPRLRLSGSPMLGHHDSIRPLRYSPDGRDFTEAEWAARFGTRPTRKPGPSSQPLTGIRSRWPTRITSGSVILGLAATTCATVVRV